MKKVVNVITIFLAKFIGVFVVVLLAIFAGAKIANAACSTAPFNCTVAACTAGAIAGGTKAGMSACGIAYSGAAVPITLQPGVYMLEVWGAGAWGGTGGNANGGYATGTVTITSATTYYVYVGGRGAISAEAPTNSSGGWNGGGSITITSGGNNAPGAGGTDIRTTQNNTYANRIIVAGGGGGMLAIVGGGTQIAGYGGGSSGGSAYITGNTSGYDGTANGGTQNSGNALGQGQSGLRAGGGGGYYGGYVVTASGLYGGGGSSYLGGVASNATFAVTAQTIAGNATQPAGSGFNVASTQTGQSGDGYVRITYLNTAPTMTIDNLSGACKKDTIAVTGKITDPDSQTITFQYKLDNGSWTTYSTSNAPYNNASWSYSLDTSSWTEGLHTIYVRSYDGVKYSNEPSTTVTIDRTPPVFSSVDSATKYTTNGSITRTATVTDNCGMVSSLAAVRWPTWSSYDGQNDCGANWMVSTSQSGNTYTITFNLATLITGDNVPSTCIGVTGSPYSTHVYAYDSAGNYTSTNGGASVYNTAPTLTTSVTNPNSWVKSGDKLNISGTITDPDTQNFTISYSLSTTTTPSTWTVCRSASSTKMGSRGRLCYV